MREIDKVEIIKRFEFMKDIYDRVDNPEFEKEELCGVFFYKGSAYCTNNHIIGRITSKKMFSSDELLFWSYCENETHQTRNYLPKINALRNFKTNFANNLDIIFAPYAENYFFIRRETLLSAIPKQFKTDPARSKVFAHVKIKGVSLHFLFFNKKCEVLDSSEVPMFIADGRIPRITHGCSFSMNLLYLYKIATHSFFDCDIIGFKLKEGDHLQPVIIFNKHNSLDRPQIYWSIAQTLLKIK